MLPCPAWETGHVLITELGVEPGHELRALHQRILAGDRALPEPPGPARLPQSARLPQPSPLAEVPRQLPAAVGCFTGRAAELAALTRVLDGRSGAATRTMVISAIGGTAGVGKTALAVEWAHQVAGEFPDGQLYVNLRGYDQGRPLTPGEALAGCLSALGVPGPRIPAEVDDRAAAYRSVLAGRRVLIVLGNVRDAEQVRPLLPGEPGCLVVVTSRDTLAGLVARDGASRVLLNVLPPGDAVALLRALIGPRVDAEPEAAARLAGLCCCLPLALRVAAELAAAQPGKSLAALAGELDSEDRLDALEAGGDQGTAVRAVFSWSYRHLTADAARTFRLAASHPGTDFGSAAVAALTGTSHQLTGRALAELTRACLLWQVGRDRYGMHDLLRAYAAELAATQDPETGRREATTRLLDHYLHTTVRAAGILFPADAPPPAAAVRAAAVRAAAVPAAAAPAGVLAAGEDVGDEPAARAWLDAERANLAAVAAYAADHEWAGHAIGLSAALFRYLDAGGLYTDALVIHGAAARGAIKSGDGAAEAGAVNNIATIHGLLGRHQEAEQYLQRALRLSREAGDQLGQLRALLNLSVIYGLMGAYLEATASCRQALGLSRVTGNRVREARALIMLGQIAIRLGLYQQAATDLVAAVEGIRAIGDLTFLTLSLISLSEAEVRQGHYHQARQHLAEATDIARQTGQDMAGADATALIGFADLREGRHQEAAQQLRLALATFHDAGVSTQEARVLCNLGELDLLLGQPAQATERYRQALTIYQRITQPSGEAEARNGLGEAALAHGELRDCRAQHQAALAIASTITTPDQQARAHEGLGDFHAASGDAAEARRHWNEALSLYVQMETPEVSRVRAKLTGPDLAG
jgi:tetratricopeptide (TPR) repeat protein